MPVLQIPEHQDTDSRFSIKNANPPNSSYYSASLFLPYKVELFDVTVDFVGRIHAYKM